MSSGEENSLDVQHTEGSQLNVEVYRGKQIGQSSKKRKTAERRLKDGESNRLPTSEVDQEAIRKSMAFMIVVDGLPFRFVENEGFRRFISLVCPQFCMPSRSTVIRDCYRLYYDEKLKLKHFLKTSSERICLTISTWTSLQKINYMCLTAHFIDNDWKLNKRILNFCPISSHKGKSIGKEVERCLLDWGIEKVMTVTFDDASYNDVAISYLKDKFSNWKTNVLNGKFLYMRCLVHVINLVVMDGLKEVGDSVARIRTAVRYVRQSPTRLKQFKYYVYLGRLDCSSSLCLDVPTRWDTTYMMLDVAVKLRRAFERLDEEDPFYGVELEPTAEDKVNGKDMWKGKPNHSDWENASRMLKFLEQFFLLTRRVSGSSNITLDTYFHELANVHCILKEWMGSDDIELHILASKMKSKYDKYWGNVKEMNLLIFVAVVLDPRYKFEYVQFALSEIYEGDAVKEIENKVKEAMYDLFNNFKQIYGPEVQGQISSIQVQHSSSGVELSRGRQLLIDLFNKRARKPELDRYLSEFVEDDSDDFDILSWWKSKSHRFPILSHVARSVLAVPISIVDSEFAFSMEERVLDEFRSSLTPKLVQALVCAQDWVRSSLPRENIEEDLTELETLEKDFARSSIFDI